MLFGATEAGCERWLPNTVTIIDSFHCIHAEFTLCSHEYTTYLCMYKFACKSVSTFTCVLCVCLFVHLWCVDVLVSAQMKKYFLTQSTCLLITSQMMELLVGVI